MILTDREIRIAIHRGLISIDPLPDESAERSAYSSTAVDLTLDPNIAIFDNPAPYFPRGRVRPAPLHRP